MTEPAIDALPGKGKRVAAVFWMILGAGVILDTQFDSLGIVVIGFGAALMLWGGIEGRIRSMSGGEGT